MLRKHFINELFKEIFSSFIWGSIYINNKKNFFNIFVIRKCYKKKEKKKMNGSYGNVLFFFDLLNLISLTFQGRKFFFFYVF